MLFSVDIDEGTRVVGYLVPDNPSASPSVRVTDGRQDLLVLPCQSDNPGLVAIGRHSTGRCVFTIDETVVSGLAHKHALEVYDNDTNLLLYRRRPPSQVAQKRIFRLETQLFPLWRLDEAIEPHFQYFQKGIDRHGRETIMQMFLLLHSTSIYLTGRLVVGAYDIYIDNIMNKANKPFTCVALLRDPYVELAERLLTLKHVRKFGNEFLGERDMITYAEAIDFAANLDVDEKVLRRAFATMPRGAIRALTDPLTRQLAARSPDDHSTTKGAIPNALGTLSEFAVVGLRERVDLFFEEFAHHIGMDTSLLPPLPEFPHVVEMARHLREMPEAELLIEKDLEIYHHVKYAHESAHRELGVDGIS